MRGGTEEDRVSGKKSEAEESRKKMMGREGE